MCGRRRSNIIADRVIFAAPTFSRLISSKARRRRRIRLFALAHRESDARASAGRDAWDNVIYDSPALGYVVATHMSLRSFVDRSVWTFYWALAHRLRPRCGSCCSKRIGAYWREAILKDLARAHPDIRDRVSRIDIMRIGHAMARPVPGFLGSGIAAAICERFT